MPETVAGLDDRVDAEREQQADEVLHDDDRDGDQEGVPYGPGGGGVVEQTDELVEPDELAGLGEPVPVGERERGALQARPQGDETEEHRGREEQVPGGAAAEAAAGAGRGAAGRRERSSRGRRWPPSWRARRRTDLVVPHWTSRLIRFNSEVGRN
jgi:hypothetical protein